MPPQKGFRGNVRRSKRVTTPKLFPPPLRARQRSGFSAVPARTTSPEARTTSKPTTLSHMNPSREEKKDSPPESASPPIPPLADRLPATPSPAAWTLS